jgi:hypothetical protein
MNTEPAVWTEADAFRAIPSGSLLLEAVAALFLLGIIAMAFGLLFVQSMDHMDRATRVSEVLPHLAQILATAGPSETVGLPAGSRAIWISPGHLEIHLHEGHRQAFRVPSWLPIERMETP